MALSRKGLREPRAVINPLSLDMKTPEAGILEFRDRDFLQPLLGGIDPMEAGVGSPTC